MPADAPDPLEEVRAFLANPPENPPWQEANLVEPDGRYPWTLHLDRHGLYGQIAVGVEQAVERFGELEDKDSHFTLTLIDDTYQDDDPFEITEAICEKNIPLPDVALSGAVFGLSLERRTQVSRIEYVSPVNGDGLRHIICGVSAGDLDGQTGGAALSALFDSGGQLVEHCPPLKVLGGLSAEQARAFNCMDADIRYMEFGPLELAKEHLTDLARHASRMVPDDHEADMDTIYLVGEGRDNKRHERKVQSLELSWEERQKFGLVPESMDGLSFEEFEKSDEVVQQAGEKLVYLSNLTDFYRVPLEVWDIDCWAVAVSICDVDGEEEGWAASTLAVDNRGLAMRHVRNLESGRERFELEQGPQVLAMLRACWWGKPTDGTPAAPQKT